MRVRSIVILLFCAATSFAQQPVPAPKQTKTICLKGGNVHVGTGIVINKGDVVFNDGKLTYVGEAKADIADAEIINCEGKEIYPGFIAPNSTLGLTEIEAVRATNDFNEVGQNNASTRALIAFYTDSKVIPTVRSNGVLMAQVTPRGGLFSGLSSIVHLDAWNWEDAIIRADDGIHLNWPEMQPPSLTEEKEGAANEKNKNYDRTLQVITKFFADAKAYGLSNPSEINLRLEAAKGLMTASKTLYIHANEPREMMDAVNISRQFGVKNIVLVGARGAYLITDFLKQNNIAVMIQRPHSLPNRVDDDVDFPFKNAALLQKAGILFCIQNEGDMEAMNSRNIPFLAGTCASYGLGREEAIASITLNPAKILGIDKTCGSLEAGKDATLFVSSGDALDMRTNNVERAYIQGRKLQLTSQQTELNERYKSKYGVR